jgi:hypothetical protein
MQENEFEKNIRMKIGELRLDPTEDVWKGVAANIHRQKRKRRVFFFLMFFAVLAGSSVTYFMLKPDENQQTLANGSNKFHETTAANSNKSSAGNLTNKSHSKTEKGEPDSTPSTVATIESSNPAKNNHTQQQTSSVKKNIAASSFEMSSQARRDLKSLSKIKVANKVEETAGNASLNNPLYTPPTNALSKSAEDGLEQKQVKSLEDQKAGITKDTVPEKLLAESEKDTLKTPLAETKPADKIKQQSNKKIIFGFTVFAGLSDNRTQLPLLTAADANFFNSPTQNTTGANITPISKLGYKSSFSYAFGFYAKKGLSKRLALSAGLNYHYYSATSSVGDKSSSSRTFFDASFSDNTTVVESYGFGRSINFKNKYGLIEVPVNLLLLLNKNQNRQIVLSAGITPAFLVSSTALYANYNQNLYYKEDKQFRKWMFSVNSGLQFPVANPRRFNISAGPEFQLGLNNITKPVIGSNQHLISAGLKVNVALK